MIRLRQSGVDEILIKRVRDWYDPGPGVFIQSLATASFSPEMLFTGSTNGGWWDPSDTTTLFQDAAGTTPVTAVEQPVGRMLDKSGRGNHAFNSSGNSANFPVLSARYNVYVNTETLATQNVATLATNYKLTFTGSGSITLSGTATGTYSAGSYTITCTAGTLTSTVSGTVTQADLRVANDALNQPAYQRVNTASDYDTVGFKPYLNFTPGTKWLQTNSIDFTSTDKMFVCAGTRKNNSTVSVMAELSQAVDSATYPGSFYFVSSEANAGATSWGLRGTSLARGITASVSTPVTEVNSAKLDLAGAGRPYEIFPRINGTDVSYGGPGTDAGTGNFGNYPLYIGARAGSSLWFNGRIYQLVVAGKQASASEITNTETYLNQKTGAWS